MSVRISRGIHRWLGFVIGLQILLWTVSGAFFAWNHIGSVRGEQFRREHPAVDLRLFDLVSADELLREPLFPVIAMNLRLMATIPVYEFELEPEPGKTVFELYDARNGELISPISKLKARAIALHDFNERTGIKSIRLIEEPIPAEYRRGPLPAWRIEFDHDSGTTIYVAANTGRITARRNHQWRAFDFLWMLHTMDFVNRDNFNHWVIKLVALLAVATVLSGYLLGFRTRRRRRKHQPSTGQS